MEFPRLTSGNLGALTFAHVNEIFRRIEQLSETVGTGNSRNSLTIGRSILIRTLQRDGAKFSWKQVSRATLDQSPAIEVQGGLSSTVGDDPFAVPVVSFGSTLEINRTYGAFRVNANDGSAFMVAFGGAPVPGLYRILSSESIGGKKWRYTGRKQIIVGSAFADDPDFTGNVTMQNGCEQVQDTGSTYGVGTVPPSGVVMSRAPIRAGVIVYAVNTDGDDLFFSIPNGYQVNCP
jgi:hypothetical protein